MVVRPDTLVAHDEGFPAGAVVPPIFQTSLFTFASYEELAVLTETTGNIGKVSWYRTIRADGDDG